MKKLFLFIALALLLSNFTPAGASNDKGKDKALETIGTISGIALYNTYIAIGGVADAYAKEVYESDYIVQLMDEQVASLNGLQDKYNELLKSGFLTDKSDIDYIKEIIKAFGYLSDEAEGLSEMAKKGDNTLFSKSRTKAWDKISDLLGFED